MTGPGAYQGYIDERSVRHVSGWVRDRADPSHRVAYEIVLPDAVGETVLHRGRADRFSDVLVRVDVGDGRYAFRHVFDPPLTTAERDGLFVRPTGSEHRLELAPALRTDPPPLPGQRTEPFQGYIDERSTRHVAGWVRNLADPAERLEVEAFVPGEAGERVVWRGAANRFSAVLREVGVGDGGYAFYALLTDELSEAERDALQVRPVAAPFRLELAPALRTAFEPISHVAMDIVDNCNLRCPFCVYDYAATHRTRFMSDAVFAQALELIPYVTDGNFWLSCLHEATLHPALLDFIGRVPTQYRRKLFYTTNLARRMPPSYFAALAASGMHHLNISLESLRPEIYERMRKGARHAVFSANWTMLLEAFAAAPAPPALRYNVMAYRSNLHEIPALVATLLDEKRAWQVEIRHTYDEPHIPPAFRDAEFLSTAEWAWLAAQLHGHDPQRVLLLLPAGGIGYDAAPAAPCHAASSAPSSAAAARAPEIPRPLNIGIAWDGTMRIYGEEPRGSGQPPAQVNYVTTNIADLTDKLGFLMAL
jgi:hypothetical protein